MLDQYDHILCASCGRALATYSGNVFNWGHSHLLAKSRFPQYETEKWNIRPRCQGWHGCHEYLDARDFRHIKRFVDLAGIMGALREYEPIEYNKFVQGLKDVGCHKYDFIKIDK